MLKQHSVNKTTAHQFTLHRRNGQLSFDYYLRHNSHQPLSRLPKHSTESQQPGAISKQRSYGGGSGTNTNL